MNRRGFLASVIAAALAPKALIEPALARYTYEAHALPFKIDPAVIESTIFTLPSTAPTTDFAAIMEPIFREVFDKAYAEPQTNWTKIFATEDGKFEVVPLTWDDMHENIRQKD